MRHDWIKKKKNFAINFYYLPVVDVAFIFLDRRYKVDIFVASLIKSDG